MPRRLSAAALRARIRTLEKQAKKLEQGASKGLRAAASLISKYGLSLDDLQRAVGLSNGKSGRRGPKRKVAVKYADGKGNKWTGRGRTPLWLVAAEKAGRKRDSFLVKKKAA